MENENSSNFYFLGEKIKSTRIVILSMKVLAEGKGELHAWMHPDKARKWMRENKSRSLIDKRITMKKAVQRFTKDGDYFAMGGFGHIRVSMDSIYEMIRQKRRNMIITITFV